MEAYTAEEIKGIVEDVGLSAEIQTDEHNFVTINVSAGEVEWIIILGKELAVPVHAPRCYDSRGRSTIDICQQLECCPHEQDNRYQRQRN